jgi:hypothetical protein
MQISHKRVRVLCFTEQVCQTINTINLYLGDLLPDLCNRFDTNYLVPVKIKEQYFYKFGLLSTKNITHDKINYTRRHFLPGISTGQCANANHATRSKASL